MPALRDVRNAQLISYAFDVIDEHDFAVMYDVINSSKNPDFSYWNYNFDLDNLIDDKCKADFRFYKNDIYVLNSNSWYFYLEK